VVYATLAVPTPALCEYCNRVFILSYRNQREVTSQRILGHFPTVRDINFSPETGWNEARPLERSRNATVFTVPRRTGITRSWLIISLSFFVRVRPSAPRFETGSVVDHHESTVEYYHIDNRSARQPDVRTDHHHLHICRHRHATVLQRIHAGKIRSWSCTEVWCNIYLS